MDKINQFLESKNIIKKLELEIDEARAKQKEIADTITLEDIKSYTYKELGKIIDYFTFKSDNKSKEVRRIYKNKRFEEYPVLKNIYHYPELMKLKDKFSMEFLKATNEILYHTGFNEYILSDSDTYWCQSVFNNKSLDMNLNYNFKLSKDEWFVLLDFLRENGIIEYKYNLYDEESECKSDQITDEQYELYSKNIGDYSKDYYYEMYLYYEENGDNYYSDSDSKIICTREDFDKLKKLISAKLCKRGMSAEEVINQCIDSQENTQQKKNN